MLMQMMMTVITLWVLLVTQKGFASLAAGEFRASGVLRSNSGLQQQLDMHTVNKQD